MLKKLIEKLKEKIFFIRLEIYLRFFCKDELPKGLKTITYKTTAYSFMCDNNLYKVEFSSPEQDSNYSIIDGGIEQILDGDIKKILDKNKNKYFIKFGLFDVSKNRIDSTPTNFNKQHFTILNYLFTIIKKFIKEEEPDILTYCSDEKRMRIFRNLYKRLLDGKFSYYTSKQSSGLEICQYAFLIKNELLESINISEITGDIEIN
jgi:hypothetical protein